MVKKLQKMAEKKSASSNLLDNQLAASVKDSAQQIWLAGMGAFSKAQQEGTKVFEALVKEGVSLQRKTQAVAEERIGDVTNKMSAMADGVSTKATKQWDKLESIFEERVAKAMGKLGVPSNKDVQALMARIDELQAQVAKMSKSPKASAKTPKTAAKTARPTARANGATKPSAKRTAARKTAPAA